MSIKLLDTKVNLNDMKYMVVKWFRRTVFFVLATALTFYGVYLMYGVLNANGFSPLEMLILLLFTITFAWISVAFCSAVFGFIIRLFRLDPLSPVKSYTTPCETDSIYSRTAILMPVYNEETSRVFAGLEAVYMDLENTGKGRYFDFYLLSDTTDNEIANAELAQFSGLKERTDGCSARLFYRRRQDNKGRKAGNIADFCSRWGAYYDFMIILDADSIMEGRTLVELVRYMQVNQNAGIIQTVPLPVRQKTLFGKFLQFAAAMYSPVLSAGMSFWQMDTANYWGHNAIIRVKAFTENCGLPELPGTPPLGGEIMSHDFVEAALMRRAGWDTFVVPEIGGSYEEVPPNIIDYAKRDRRWVQGNLQHIKLINASGMHPLSRFHLIMGVLAYFSSFLWLLMLIISTIDAILRSVTDPVYFNSAYQLFPDWPVTRTHDIFSLLGIVAVLLFLPKLTGIFLYLIRSERRAAFGGGIRLLLSSLLEIIIAVIIAPIMMCFHAFFVTGVLCGWNVSWDPQNRKSTGITWKQASGCGYIITLFGLIWGLITAWLSPVFFLWLTPVLTGMVLSIPVIVISSRELSGSLMKMTGIFKTPSETFPPDVLSLFEKYYQFREGGNESAFIPDKFHLLPQIPVHMPVQRVNKGTGIGEERLTASA